MSDEWSRSASGSASSTPMASRTTRTTQNTQLALALLCDRFDKSFHPGAPFPWWSVAGVALLIISYVGRRAVIRLIGGVGDRSMRSTAS